MSLTFGLALVAAAPGQLGSGAAMASTSVVSGHHLSSGGLAVVHTAPREQTLVRPHSSAGVRPGPRSAATALTGTPAPEASHVACLSLRQECRATERNGIDRVAAIASGLVARGGLRWGPGQGARQPGAAASAAAAACTEHFPLIAGFSSAPAHPQSPFKRLQTASGARNLPDSAARTSALQLAGDHWAPMAHTGGRRSVAGRCVRACLWLFARPRASIHGLALARGSLHTALRYAPGDRASAGTFSSPRVRPGA